MCGLVGIMGSDNKLSVPFNFLLEVDAIRGKDSTGILSVDLEGQARWLKDAVIPPVLMLDDDYDTITGGGWGNAADKMKPFLLIGHNRAATKGDISADNAHPFEHKHIFLTHNGTIHNQYPLTSKLDVKFDTDSETLTSFVAEFGIKEAWKNMAGAAALAYYNQTDNTLNLISNGERPLFFGMEKDNKYIIYASELWMLHGAEARYDLDIEKYYTLKKDNLHVFKFDPKKVKVNMIIEQLEKYIAPKIWPIKAKHHMGQWFDTDTKEWKHYPRTDYGAANSLVIHKIGKRKRKKLEKKADKTVPKIIEKATSYSEAMRLVFEPPFKGEPAYNVILRRAVSKHFSDKASAAVEKDKVVRDELYGHLGEQFEGSNQTINPEYPLAIVEMDEVEFHALYKECFYCYKSLEHEYDEAVIFSPSKTDAICGECANTADANDMYLPFSL